jgi:hypothetical protein
MQLLGSSQHFMEPEGSLPSSQELESIHSVNAGGFVLNKIETM